MYADVYVTQQAKSYLETFEHNQPWFCWVSFGGPHEPWDAPEPYASMYDPDSMPAPIPRPSNHTDRPQGWLDYFMEHRSPKLEPGDEAAMHANYAGNVTLIDDQIGEILAAIEKRGELDNTIIGFTSDDGEMNGDWGLIYKMNFLDSSARVPLIFRSPETASNGGGKTVDLPVENCDLGATIVDLSGGEIEYRQFGHSLKSTFSNGNSESRFDAISEISGEFMYTDGHWKMALNREGEVYLLFNLDEDPDEVVNLAGDDDYGVVRSELSQRLIERISRSQLKEPWY